MSELISSYIYTYTYIYIVNFIIHNLPGEGL